MSRNDALNLVEALFGIINSQAIERGTFTLAKGVDAKIRVFIMVGMSVNIHLWMKTPVEILTKSHPKPVNNTLH